MEKLHAFLRHGYVLLAVCLSFVLFNGESLPQVGRDLAGMFGFGGLPVMTAETLYYLRSYGRLFALGIVGATPLVKSAALRVAERKWAQVLEPMILMALLLICTAYLVDGSFSPFLYFRF